MREAMVKAAIEDNLKQKQDLVETRVSLVETINQAKAKLEQVDRDNLSRIEYNSSKIAEFEKSINQNKAFIQDIRDSVKECTKQTVEMQERKLNASIYNKELTIFRDQFQALSFALKDNFS